jgi:cytochrome c peroxidase
MKKLMPVFGMLCGFMWLTSCEPSKSPVDFTVVYYTQDEKAILDRTLNLDEYPPSYKNVLPVHLANTGLFPRQVSDDKAVLGRVLFYDKSLSSNGKVSCASCHKQEIGFADNARTSKGVDDREGTRNSIALASVANFSAYYGTDLNGSGAIRFFWDNRAQTAKEQAKGSLANHDEMNMDMAAVVSTVKSKDYYAPLFRQAFADNNVVSEENVLDAISSFVDAMGSYKSKFDIAAAKSVGTSYDPYNAVQNDFSDFTSAENRGKQLYQTNCAGCHSPVMGRPIFNHANNGLDATVTTDKGVGGVSEFQSDPMSLGAFKVPTLRNIALTAPYMHDGRFTSLEEVVNHYSDGIKSSATLHELLKQGGQPVKMNFSDSDKTALIAFLNTMTDNSITDKSSESGSRFSDPFK